MVSATNFKQLNATTFRCSIFYFPVSAISFDFTVARAVARVGFLPPRTTRSIPGSLALLRLCKIKSAATGLRKKHLLLKFVANVLNNFWCPGD